MRTYPPSWLFLVLFTSVAAQAEDKNEVFELDSIDVVSTATRTAQPVKGVSASVRVIGKEEIAKSGAQTVKDIFRQTPGLSLQYGTFPAASSASKSSVSLRGVGASGTLWLVDGRRLAGEVKNPYDMDRIPAASIERIEIVKGPMSALYGADAVGGVINIITKQPRAGEVKGDVSVGYGSNADGDGANKNLSAGLRGGKDRVRYSLNVSRQQSDPYTEREQTNTRVGSGQHASSEIPPTPGYLNPAGPTGGKPFYLQSNGSVSAMPLDSSLLAGDQQAAQAAFTEFRDQVQANVQDSYPVDVTYREEADVNTVSGRVEFDLTDKVTSGVEFNWFEEEREGIYRAAYHPMGYIPPMGHGTNPIAGHDANGNPLSMFQVLGQLKGKIPAWDLPVRSTDENKRLDWSADIKWEVSETLEFNARAYVSDYEKRNATTLVHFSDFGYPNEQASASNGMNANVTVKALESSATWYSPDDRHVVTGGVEVRDEDREATVFTQSSDMTSRGVSSWAAYLQDEWALDESVKLTFGGRFDSYTQDAYVDAGGQQRDEEEDGKATFRIGVNKALNDQVNIRANVAQGYRVPDIRELYIQKQTPAGVQLGAYTIDTSRGKEAYDLQPESTNAFEVGLKGDYGQLSYDVAVFYNLIEDRIQQVQVGSDASAYYTFKNIDEAATKGIELELKYAFNTELSGRLNWSELDTENKETGKPLEFTPERTASVGLNWSVDPRWELGADIAYVGEQFYTEAGMDKTTDAYSMLNLNTTYALDNKQQWSLSAGVRNVTDEQVDKELGSDPGRFVHVGLRGNF